MRKRYYWSPTGAGQRWPDPAATGGRGAVAPFNWVKIDNRGANPVRFGLNAQVADDLMDYYATVKNGTFRVFNVAGPKNDPEHGDGWPHELSMLSVTGATTVMIEISDHPIVDLDFTP